MLDTVPNLGLNDVSVEGLAAKTENERFAWDSYRRFVQMFGNVVHGIEGSAFEDAIKAAKSERGVETDVELDAGALRELTATFKALYEFPQDPLEQLRQAIRAVFGSYGQAGDGVPAHQPDPGRVGHGGQRAADGVREHGGLKRLGRRVLARRGDRRAGALQGLPGQRAGRERGLACATRATSPSWPTCCPTPTPS